LLGGGELGLAAAWVEGSSAIEIEVRRRTHGCYLRGARRAVQGKRRAGAASDSTVESTSVTSKGKKTAPTSGPQTSAREGKGQSYGWLRPIGPARLAARGIGRRGRPGKLGLRAESWEGRRFLFSFPFPIFQMHFQIVFEIISSCNKNQSIINKICSGMYAQACI
jgi:hypothetical protein